MRMTLDELTQAMHDFVGGKGWYEPDSAKPQTPKNIACSLAIEAAEVLEHFQWSEDSQDVKALASELADVALYLLQLASLTGINLEQAILDKLAVNARRTWPMQDEGIGSSRADTQTNEKAPDPSEPDTDGLPDDAGSGFAPECCGENPGGQ
jgi:NTP pyrophosphatase (non-canonical NTP hydrolase)